MSEVYVVKSTSQVISGFPVGSILYVSRSIYLTITGLIRSGLTIAEILAVSGARRRRTPPTPIFLPRRRRRKKRTA